MPPTITRGPTERIDRLGILGEHDEVTGLLLWRSVRDLELWISTPPESRPGLSTATADENRRKWLAQSELPAEVRAVVAALADLLAPGSAGASSGEVGAACAAVGLWARDRGAGETAVAYAQAAALAVPEHSPFALLTGCCAEELGQHPRAATWYQRAISVSRRGRDLPTYAAAYLALAEQALTEEKPALARRRALRALRATRRAMAGARPERARAAYVLFRLARSADNDEARDRYASECTRLAMRGIAPYGAAVLDLAEHWLTHQRIDRARRLLDHLSPGDPLERFAAAVLRVRIETAGKAPIAVRRALAEALELADSPAGDPGAFVTALLQLAGCAAEVGDAEALARVSKAALTHAPAEGHAEVSAALQRIARIARLPDAA